jgi:pimeloyl-ACP methyl ester carboxylesterase
VDLDPAELDRRLPAIDWAQWPRNAVRDRIQVPSGSLARVTMGPPGGRRVVLVPGATGSKEDFRRVMPLLAEAGYRAESFDLAGQFESAGAGPERLAPPKDRYDLELFVDDLLTVLKDGEEPAHLLGYSFAGTVAAVAAARRSEAVATLTLLSTPPLSGRSLRGMRWVGPLARHASPPVSAAVLLWGIRLNLAGGGRMRHDFMRARLRHTRLDSVRDIMTLMTDTPDVSDMLRSASIPTLLAIGRRDLWPVRQHRAFAETIGARLAVYRAGHGPCETAPHQLTADMLRLFAQADRSG